MHALTETAAPPATTALAARGEAAALCLATRLQATAGSLTGEDRAALAALLALAADHATLYARLTAAEGRLEQLGEYDTDDDDDTDDDSEGEWDDDDTDDSDEA